MNISSYEELGVVVITLSGRVDSDGANQLKQALNTQVEAGNHKLLLVMRDVSYINSAGLRVLADVVTTTQQHGGNVRLVELTERVRRVFEIIGFLQFFPVYDNVIEALDWLD